MLRGTLRQYLRFALPTTNRNKARWWEILLDNIDKLKLTISKESKSIEQMSAWVDRQVAPTMAAILTALDGDMSWFRKLSPMKQIGSHRNTWTLSIYTKRK